MFKSFIQFMQELLGQYIFQDPIFHLYLWQLASIAILLLLGGIAIIGLLASLNRVLPKSTREVLPLGKVRRRLLLLGLILLFVGALPDLAIPSKNALLSNLVWVLHIIAALLILSLLSKTTDLFFVLLLRKVRTNYKDQVGLVQMGRSITKALVLCLAMLFLPRFFVVYNLSSLLTKLSIGAGTFTAIIALASKDFISNFFGALVIMISKPFQVGDWIAVDKFEGRVIMIDMRATKLRTSQGILVYVPNGIFTNKNVKNYGKGSYTQVKLSLAWLSLSDEQLAKLLAHLQELLKANASLKAGASHVQLGAVSKSSAEIIFHLTFDTVDEQKKVIYLQRVMQEIYSLAEKEGIKLEG